MHWPYAKILSYSLQGKPFIHVDGDVYLPKRLTSLIESGELIAQNREIGTSDYRGMVDYIDRNDNPIFPNFLSKEVFKDPIPSYNMGVIGGNNFRLHGCGSYDSRGKLSLE